MRSRRQPSADRQTSRFACRRPQNYLFRLRRRTGTRFCLTFYMKLYQDQFRHFQDPEAPYFMFMSKDSRLAMGMGGTVRMRSYFDWGGAIAQPPFAPALFLRGIQLRTSRRFQRSVAMGTTVRTAREFLFLKIYPSVANKDAGPGVTSTKKFKKTTLL